MGNNFSDLESNYIKIEKANIHYLKMGAGDQILFCFHGFGQNAAHYVPLAEKIKDKYVIYSFDLFFHGKSEWPDQEKAVPPQLMVEAIKKVIQQEKVDKISLCGYSMGGKITLSILPFLSIKIEQVILIAPDGVKTNFWYNLATYPHWSRRIFRYMIMHPRLFFDTAYLLRQLRMVDKGLVKFASGQMSSMRKRRQVYCTWMAYRHFKPDLAELSRHINEHQINVVMYLGRYDKIIRADNMQRLLKRIPDRQKMEILEAGHNTLISDVAQLPNLPL
jgi:pimeloyl-ACP methyl ester carboxylesterase